MYNMMMEEMINMSVDMTSMMKSVVITVDSEMATMRIWSALPIIGYQGARPRVVFQV